MYFENIEFYSEPEYLIVGLYGTEEEKKRHAELLELIFNASTEPGKLIEYYEEMTRLTENVKRRELTRMNVRCGRCCDHYRGCAFRKRDKSREGDYCCSYCGSYESCLAFYRKFKDKLN